MSRQTWPVGLGTSTFSWITWPFKITFSNCALPIFLPLESNRGARKVTSSVCHSPAGRPAFTRGGDALVNVMVPG